MQLTTSGVCACVWGFTGCDAEQQVGRQLLGSVWVIAYRSRVRTEVSLSGCVSGVQGSVST